MSAETITLEAFTPRQVAMLRAVWEVAMGDDDADQHLADLLGCDLEEVQHVAKTLGAFGERHD